MTDQPSEKHDERYLAVPESDIDPAVNGRPCGELTAWLWLIKHASRSARTISTLGGQMKVGRGEVVAGSEHLAEAWGWGRTRVRNYLRRLVKRGRVVDGPKRGRSTNQSKGHYPATFFIVNFDAYRGAGTDRGQSKNQSKNQLATSQRPVSNHTLIKEQGTREKGDPRAREDQIPKDQFGVPVEGPEADVRFDGTKLTLINGERADWLKRFDDDPERLDLALTQAAGFIQQNGNKSLLVQVRTQLARAAADKFDRAKNHAKVAAARTPAQARPKASDEHTAAWLAAIAPEKSR